jgi:chromosome partitioning protein
VGDVISMVIQCGGSAKTTTVTNLAYALQSYGKKVCCIDMDSQSSLSENLNFLDVDSLEHTIYEVLLGEINIEDAIYETEFNFDLIPSKTLLSSFFIQAMTNLKKYPEPFYILKKYIDIIRDSYDYILIDNSPSLDYYTVSSMTASDKILVPMQCEPKSIRGLNILFDAYNNIKEVYNPNLEVLGIIGTLFNRNTNISTTVLQEIRKKYDGIYKVFDSVIYRTVKFSESDLFHKPALSYSDNEQVKEYYNLAKEVFLNGR